MNFKLETEYIKLDSLLKALNLSSSGGEAKLYIQDGQVQVNGQVEIQRGKKLYKGDVVTFNGKVYTIGD